MRKRHHSAKRSKLSRELEHRGVRRAWTYLLHEFLYKLISRHRSQRTNRQLGGVLAFVAGAVNAGGYLAVRSYTSHMSGIVSAIADDLVLGSVGLATAGFVSLSAFIAGAATCSIVVNWGSRKGLHGKFGVPLFVEALLLLVFGLLGANLASWEKLLVPTTVLLLCFIMGLQNAVVTKISNAEIRTTHMTGIVTDLGIELGRMLYWNRTSGGLKDQKVIANKDKLFIHSAILSMFFLGGLLGAWGFKAIGFVATVPVAVLLLVLAAPSIVADIRPHKEHPK